MLNLMLMSTLLAADDVPAAARRDYWLHVLDEVVGPIDLQTAGLDSRDRLRSGEIGAVRVVDLRGSNDGVASLTARRLRESDPDVCKIDVLVRGRGVVEQDGRQARLEPGDFALVDLSRPARWVLSPMRLVVVAFPRALLPLRQDEIARLTAVRIAGDRGPAALVSSLARQLVDHLDGHGVDAGARLGTAVLDLLTVGLAGRLDRGAQVPAATGQRALRLRVQAFIEQRLADPELSPGMIAAAHYISERYLYKLFESEQTGVAGWIRRRRLERCRRDLLDPALRQLPVSAIAARWGMPSAPHFSRAFRAAYGVPPREFRLLADTR
jgi:AraC-like DNA-binding protein